MNALVDKVRIGGLIYFFYRCLPLFIDVYPYKLFYPYGIHYKINRQTKNIGNLLLRQTTIFKYYRIDNAAITSCRRNLHQTTLALP